MDKQEFLLLIPAIVYGVAIVDLLKVFRHKVYYWELLLWGVLMLMSIIIIWIDLYRKLGAIVDSNLSFILIIIQAIVYAQVVAVLTPEDESISAKDYFNANQKTFFMLMALSSLVNLAVEFVVFDDSKTLLRLVAIPLLIACAYLNKVWLRTLIALMIAFWGVNALFLS